MKAPSSAVRFTEASKLLDYGFSTYTYKQFANAEDVLKNVEINKGVNSSLNLVYEENAGTLIKKGEDKNIEEILTIENSFVFTYKNRGKRVYCRLFYLYLIFFYFIIT